MEPGVLLELLEFDEQDRHEAFQVIELIISKGPHAPASLPVNLHIRGEWWAGYSYPLRSHHAILLWAPVEDEEGELVEVLYPLPDPWEL